MPRTGTEIIHSLNPTLAYLLSIKNRNANFAIVDTSGNGHFALLSEAITGGAKHIFIKNGTYEESSDITITDQFIIGETRSGVVIKLNDAKISYLDTGDFVNSSTTQKVKFTNDSVLVQKAGSSDCDFTDVTADENTRLYSDTLLAQVDAITDINNLNMKYKFFGRITNLAGSDLELSYSLVNFNSKGSYIGNLTFNHFLTSDLNCLEISGTNHIVDNVSFYSIQNRSTFILVGTDHIAVNLLINNCSFEGGDIGIDMQRAGIVNVTESHFNTMESYFIKSNTISEYINIENNVFSATINALYLNGKFTTVSNNDFSFIENSAINFPTTGINFLKINYNTFKYCGDNGTTEATIINNSESAIVTNNSFDNCRGCFENNGDKVVFSTNVIDNCLDPINLSGDYILISENIFTGATTGDVAIDTIARKSTFKSNQFIDYIPISNLYNGIFTNNIVIFTTITALTITASNGSVNANIFEKAQLTFSSDKTMFRGNKVLDISSGYAITVTADKCLFSGNFIGDSANGIDIQATADKTHLLQCIFDNITTTAINDSGTNTVQANNIT